MSLVTMKIDIKNRRFLFVRISELTKTPCTLFGGDKKFLLAIQFSMILKILIISILSKCKTFTNHSSILKTESITYESVDEIRRPKKIKINSFQ